MAKPLLFVMAGGGTGGHVIPALAVAREVVSMGHEVLFVGTDRGVESKLVPQAGFRLEKIRVGGIKGLGLVTKLSSLWRLGVETLGQIAQFGKWKPAAVFSMGGYVAGPPVIAAIARGVPIVAMEPNAVPGFTNRKAAKWVKRALVSFESTKAFFPAGHAEVTGLPVRDAFFQLAPRKPEGVLNVLITGGSQGSRTLNLAARQAWPLIREAGLPVRLVHQTGTPMVEELTRAFANSGLDGSISAFLNDMPGAFGQADLIICRSGAGAVSELAAAGKPSVLVPFPFAADDHQQKNAEAFEKAGAALLFRDAQWTGRQFFQTLQEFCDHRDRLTAMGAAARSLAKPGAARRAAQILLESAQC